MQVMLDQFLNSLSGEVISIMLIVHLGFTRALTAMKIFPNINEENRAFFLPFKHPIINQKGSILASVPNFSL
jgi:hypothetical protein